MTARSRLITGHSYDAKRGVLTLWSGDHPAMTFRVGEQVALAACPERWCVGVRHGDGTRKTCEAQATSGSYCVEHATLNRALGCLNCTPWACRNPHREAAACGRSHYVYLALHGRTDGLDGDARVKIGVSRADRYEQRVAEQGAFAALAISRAVDGQQARLFERRAVELGWGDRLNIAAIMHLPQPGPTEAAMMLDDHRAKLIARASDLPWQPVATPVLTLGPYPHAPAGHGPLRALDIRNEGASGELIGRRGGHLVLATSNPVEGERLCTLSMRSLHGRRIARVDPDAEPVAVGQQAALW